MQRALIDGGVVVYHFVVGALCALTRLVLYNLTTCTAHEVTEVRDNNMLAITNGRDRQLF